MLTLLGVTAIASAGGAWWYTQEGFSQAPDTTAVVFTDAVRAGEYGRAYDLLTPRSRTALTFSQFQQLIRAFQQRLPADSSGVTVVKDDGFFARGATLTLHGETRAVQRVTRATPPLRLQLENGRWRVVATNLYAHAMVALLPDLRDLIPPNRPGEQHFGSRSDIDRAVATEKAKGDELLRRVNTWHLRAVAFDDSFKAQGLLKEAAALRQALDPALVEAARRARTAASRDRLNDLMIQAFVAFNMYDNERAAAIYRQVLASPLATQKQRSDAQGGLEEIAGRNRTKAHWASLEQANRAYDRAEHQKAIAILQELLAEDDLTVEQRAQVNYLLSFAYRDFEDVPNNMQKAIDAARAATDADPSNGEYWCNLGDRLRQYKVHGESTRAFLRGISRASTSKVKADCYVYYGWNLYEDDDYDGARAAWEKAVDLDPQNPDALRALNQ
ncbi:tetratricopeptide repeat protein [Deinococcus yavapaiensis]|uniref:tetratricopeptide repeat protein n=1 Tax=Deinococcus yavapaiensis TaxID=309889 RepID=UPI000DA1CE9D|nr:tetratricopeptide repeat protein [Deinococcus yavapaiensis]